MIFYSADHHFGKGRIIELVGRPFGGVEEMDDALVKLHNERVERSDDVWFLGDFGHGDERYLSRVFNRLKGRKHLIVGNHDRKEVLRLNWSSAPKHKAVINDGGRTVVLSHYPERSWDKMYRGSYHLFGHTHGKLPGVGRSTDVGVDAWDYRPVTADEAIGRMMEWNSDFDSYAPEHDSVISYAAPAPAM